MTLFLFEFSGATAGRGGMEGAVTSEDDLTAVTFASDPLS